MEKSSAIVVGTGGIGSALLQQVRQSGEHSHVYGFSRKTQPAIDYTHEDSLLQTALWLKQTIADTQAPLKLIVVATGVLHDEANQPERSWSQLNAQYLQQMMLVNTIGPALLVKHFFPLLSKQAAVKVAFLSAKVGSIGDNGLGGWYGYRASKAALNQIIKTASIELTRFNANSCCVALHPGTVDTALSAPFAKKGLLVRPASAAAHDLMAVMSGLTPAQTGGFFDYTGQTLPW